MARHARKGDLVEVIAGKFKGKQGKVVEVLTTKERVRIEGVCLVKRHLKRNQDGNGPEGGITEKLGSIHWSNVLPVCPKTGKPSKVGFRLGENGKKERFAKRSGVALEA